MSRILFFSKDYANSNEVFPQLELLRHKTKLSPIKLESEISYSTYDLVIIDGRKDLAKSRALSKALGGQYPAVPIILLTDEGGLAAVSISWRYDDIVVDTASPAEVEARIRLVLARTALKNGMTRDSEISAAGVVIDESSYSAKVNGELLNLTYKEFELLKYLAQNPGHVFSRKQLLEHVWGYDYYGGTRTVDVHIRRLRSKLGTDHEYLINTVRNVGYKFKEIAATQN